MWRIFATLIAIATVIGCMTVDNPKEQMQLISSYIVGAYNYVITSINDHPSHATAIATPIGTTIGWILAYFFLFRNKNGHLVHTPTPEKKVEELPISVVERADARNLYKQLEKDLIALENRADWLPQAVETATSTLSEAVQTCCFARNALAQKEKERDLAEKQLDRLIKEMSSSEKEIRAINEELRKLKDKI